MLLIFYICIFFVLSVAIAAHENSTLPTLLVDGFTWAENLAFDGKGHMFVSEAVHGYLYNIYLCNDGTEYCKDVYLRGFDRIGGLAITPDGNTIYIGVAFKDNTNGIVYTTTDVNKNIKGL